MLLPAKPAPDVIYTNARAGSWEGDLPSVSLNSTRATATVGETVTFTAVVSNAQPPAWYMYNLTGPGQPDTLLSHGLVSAGAQFPPQHFTFSSPGTYTVTLYVQDRRGAWGQGAASVTVTAPPTGLTARFVIEQQVRDQSGALSWQPLPAGTVVEQGLRLRFDASASGPGAAYYSFDFGDGGGNANPAVRTALYAFARPGTYLVTLTVYDASGYQSASTTASVSVASGLVFFADSSLAIGGASFVPAACRVDSTDAWVLDIDGRVAMLPYADPTFPIVGQIVADGLMGGPAPCPVSVGTERYLIASNGTRTVRVYRVVGMSLTPLGTFTVPETASSSTTAFAAVQNRLFIGTGVLGKLYEYDLGQVVQSPTAAQPVRSWSVSGGAMRLAVCGTKVFSGGQTNTLTVLSCPSGNGAPTFTTLILPGGSGAITELCAAPDFVITRHSQRLTFVDRDTLQVLGQCSGVSNGRMATDGRRLFELTPPPHCRIVKRDCTNPNAVYDMQVYDRQHDFQGFAFCATVNVGGSPQPVLYVADRLGPLFSFLTRP